MEPEKNTLKYATMSNQLIQAIVGGHFRFASEVQAKTKLASLHEQFIHSSKRPEGLAPEAVYLWIKGFGITEKDTKQGYKGNFAVVMFKPAAAKSAGGVVKYTLFAAKHDVELKQHPMQARKKTSHPNWGHPILKSIKKGKLYKSLKAAEADLQALHEEYPTTTIPLGNKLNVMVYSKKQGEENPDVKPIKKHVLEIKHNTEGLFFIEISDKQEKKAMPVQLPQATTAKAQEPQEVLGKFTSMVQLKRNKKKK